MKTFLERVQERRAAEQVSAPAPDSQPREPRQPVTGCPTWCRSPDPATCGYHSPASRVARSRRAVLAHAHAPRQRTEPSADFVEVWFIADDAREQRRIRNPIRVRRRSP